MATLKFYDDFLKLDLWAGSETTGTWHTPETWAEAGMSSQTATWWINPLYPATSQPDANPLSVSNSILNLGIIKTPADVSPANVGSQPYISAYLCTRNRFYTTYGYFEARIQMPHTNGFIGAFWMMPQGGGWPPELDISEVVSDAATVSVTSIWSNDYGSNPTDKSTYTNQADTSVGFHYYAVNWQSDFVTWYFDGVQVFQVPTPSDFHQDFYIIFDAAADRAQDWGGAPDASTVFPAAMLVDYVAVWDVSPYANGAGGTGAGLNLNAVGTGGGSAGSTGGPGGGSGSGGTGGTGGGTTSSPVFYDNFTTNAQPWMSHATWASGDQFEFSVPGQPNGSDNGSDTFWVNPINVPGAASLYALTPSGLQMGLMVNPGTLGISTSTDPKIGTIINTEHTPGGCNQLYAYWEFGVQLPNVNGFMFAFDIEDLDSDVSGSTWTAELDIILWVDANGVPHVVFRDAYTAFIKGSDVILYSTTSVDVTKPHVYGIDWQSDFIKCYIDGVQVGASYANPGGAYRTNPMFAFFYTNDATYYTGTAAAAGSLPAHATLSYVEVWNTHPTSGGGTGTVSANGAIVFIGDGTSINSSNGHQWTINASGQVVVDGTADTSVSGVTELAYVSGQVWRLEVGASLPYITPGNGSFTDGSGNVYSLDSSGNADENGSPMNGGGGTGAMEFYNGTVYGQDSTTGNWFTWDGTQFNGPVTAPPAPGSVSGWAYKVLPTDAWTNGSNPLVSVTFESQNNAVVKAGSAAKLIDGNGNAYGILAGEVVANGVADTTTSNVVEIAYVNGDIWQFNSTLWWYETSPSGPWQPSGGTTSSPLPTIIGFRDPANQPFTTASVWNVGIGAGATWGVGTDADVAQLVGLTGNILGATNGQTIAVGGPSDPVVQITCSDTVFPLPVQSVHVPATAVPSPGADGWMNFFDLSQPAKLWSYAGCVLNNGKDVTGGITAVKGGLWDCNGDGVANATTPGSDYNFFAGTITDYDLASSAILHALRFSLGLNALKSPGATWTASIPWPGTHEDKNGPTTYTGHITYGSTIGIPASTTIPANLTQGGTMLATALQKYGAICRIGTAASSTINFYTTPESDTHPYITQMRGDLPTIVPLLRVMRNQGPATVNGGGVPAPTALPPINPNPIYYQPKWRLPGTQAWTLFGRPTPNTNAVITGLPNNTQIQLQVDAYNASGLISSTVISDSTTNTAITITGITLSSTTISPGSPAGTVVGNISVATTGGSFTGTLSLAGTNASQFSISNSQLVTAVALTSSASVQIVATQAGASGSPFTSSPFTISIPSGTGPAASSSFVTIEFSTKVNMPNNSGPVVIPRETFGVAAAKPCDNDFAVLTNSTFQATSSSLDIPLVRLNCNSGLCTTWQNTFPNGPNGTPNFSAWQPFIDNIGKCVNLATTKVVIGVGWPSNGTTNGYSDADFAHAAAQVVSHLRTTPPTGGGSPVNPLYWEYLNEQGSTSSSGFNAFVDAINAVGSGYTCLGPTSANIFGQVSTLINGIGTRAFIPDVHAYLYCQGADPTPSDQQMAQAQTAGSGTTPSLMAGNINSTCDGHLSGSVPFFWGEWNLECGAAAVAEEQNIVCALFAASNLFKCAAAINRPLWGGIWEWAGDQISEQFYGIIQSDSAIAPVGYFLSKATQKMPGTMVSTTMNSAPNMAGWSTQSATAGNFGVYLHNWGGNAQSGLVALSHLPVSGAIDSNGNGSATVWTQSGSTPTGGSVSTVAVTNGVTSTITVPSMGQVIISVP